MPFPTTAPLLVYGERCRNYLGGYWDDGDGEWKPGRKRCENLGEVWQVGPGGEYVTLACAACGQRAQAERDAHPGVESFIGWRLEPVKYAPGYGPPSGER